MVSVPVRREQVAYGRERGLPVRRACTLFSVGRSSLGYQGSKIARDAAVIAPMKALAAQYPRFGYRRLRIFPRRYGHPISPARASRPWKEGGSPVLRPPPT